MRHKVKKIKFNFGKDANKSLIRKLAINFLDKGYLQTTITRAKAVKSYIEKLITKMKTKNESNKNYLLKYLGNKKIVEDGFNRVGPALSKIQGGYVKIIKVGMRNSDGSLLAKIEWAYPVVKLDSIKTSSSAQAAENKLSKKQK